MLEIFASASVADDDRRLRNVIDDLPEKHFENLVASGRINATEIWSGGSGYKIFWCFEAGGKNMHVCASLAIGDVADPSVWGNGVETIARRHNCAAVTFSTSRRGHVADAEKWGAVVTGVTMKKVL